MSHPIVVAPPIVAVPVADMLPVTSVFPPIVVAPPIAAVPVVSKSPVTLVSPVISVSPVIEVSPVIVVAPFTVRTSFSVVAPATSRVPPADMFWIPAMFPSTCRFPVISTSHRYHARSEKSPLICVPLDNVNVYNPSNGSESGLVGAIDSNLTSWY